MKKVYLYSDGSSDHRNKTGGWAFCLTENYNVEKYIHRDKGFHKDTTNNRMELLAIMNGLYFIKGNLPITGKVYVYSDSRYATDPFYFGWVDSWEQSGWCRADGTPTKNADLWVEFKRLVESFRRRGTQIEFCWVKGHSSNPINNYCDILAKRGRLSKKVNKLY